jgi:hypothetical protein
MSEHETQRQDEGEPRPDAQGRDRKERLLQEMHDEKSAGAATPEPTGTTDD